MLGCLYIRVSLKIQLCLKIWYNVIRWSSHICKKKFLSLHSFLVKFSKNVIMEIIQSPPTLNLSYKMSLRFWNKKFLTESFLKEIYRNIQAFALKVLQERQEIVQCKCFSDTKQKHVCWKFCKVRKVFGCVVGAFYFQCQVSWGS